MAFWKKKKLIIPRIKGKINQQKSVVSGSHENEVAPSADSFIDENSNVVESSVDTAFSNVIIPLANDSLSKLGWYVVAASAIGKSHTQSNLPCQDNHYCEGFGNGWGVAICCDGAGSAANSQIGSAYVANVLSPSFFKKLVFKNGWLKKNKLPTQDEWTTSVRIGFKQIHFALEEFAREREMDPNSLACTVTVVIYSPKGLLVAHIGDGRAGYCNEANEWKPLIVPHKGSEANQTIFLTSKHWVTDSNFSMSGVSVPECHVIDEKAMAFTLMSDGCEAHSFQCSVMDKESNKWSDPNLPYPKFFNPLVTNLRSMCEHEVSSKDANEKWKKFVTEGTAGIKSEPDDKSLILAISI